jgi:uncharacterized membrane protein YqjE
MSTYSDQRRYQREPTLGELFSDLSSQASLLVRQEAQLAKVEMTEKAAKAGREVAYIVVGAVLGNAALLTLIASLILFLRAWISPWVAALLVGAALAIVAGIFVWIGRQGLQRIEPTPTRTVETLQEDKEWLAAQMN